MPEYLSPGVYIEEVSTGPRPIEGVSTSTTAMLGPTERGPEYPVLVTSWLEYQRWFGGYRMPDNTMPGNLQSFMPYAVQGFFDNGGQRLFVARILGNNPNFATRTVDGMEIKALGRGGWGARILVRIERGSKVAENPNLFKLTLLYYSPLTVPDMAAFMANFVDPLDPRNNAEAARREPDRVEMYDNLLHTRGSPNFVETIVNSGSFLVRVMVSNPDNPSPVLTDIDPFERLVDVDPATLQGAPIDINDYTGDLDPIDDASAETIRLFGRGRGLLAVQAIDEVSLLLAPDEVQLPGGNTLTQSVIGQCERLRDRFAVVSAPAGEIQPTNVNPPQDTSYAAYYYPWITVYDPISRGPLRVPPSGHIAGLIARTDIERGVHKAPANEVVRGAQDLEFPITKGAQDILNPKGVNCIRDFRPDGRGIRLWGARTMSSNAEWKYINVRRLFLYIEESIEEGTQWVVFEPNDEPLWAQVRRSIANFLIRVWRSGALMGLTEEEAFFVKCDRTTMTQDDIDNGRLICYIGIAPVKPAEFVIFRISQKTAEAPA